MIPNTEAVTTSISSEAEDIRMEIDQEALVHLMGVLTNLYQDRLAAVIREYSTNAWDSHVSAGVEDPIEVTLPTQYRRQIVIADHGLGLSADDLRQVYGFYGRSTKRNDNSVAGMLGLGSKSGLTYANSINITAVKDGVKTWAVVTKSEDGVGVIKILSSAETDERNGVTVSIPVREYDVRSARDKALDLFHYWRPGTVLVDGQPVSFPDDEKIIWLDPDVALVRGAESRIVMGNVPYPFEPNLGRYYGFGVVAWVPMGTVDPTPSREGLKDTSNTRESVSLISNFVTEHLKKAVAERVKNAGSPWERTLIASEWNHWNHYTQPVYEFNHDDWFMYHGGVASKQHRHVHVRDLANKSQHVVLGYVYGSVSGAHKNRLNALGIDRALLLPTDDSGPIEGRPNVHRWADIVALTQRPRQPRGEAKKTLYGYWLNGSFSTAHVLPKNVPHVYYTGSTLPETYRWLYSAAAIAVITERQVAKFLRLHPAAISIYDYVYTEQRSAIAAITEDDKAKWALRDFAWYAFSSVINEIDDPLVARAVELQRKADSKTFLRAKELNLLHKIPAHPIAETLFNRYPLLKVVRISSSDKVVLAELTTYLNAKHTTEVLAA